MIHCLQQVALLPEKSGTQAALAAHASALRRSC